MESKPRADIKDLVIDTSMYLPNMPIDKVMLLKYETSLLISKYNRGDAITFITTNFSPHKHVALTALNGMGDTRVLGYLDRIMNDIDAEVAKRESI